MTFVEALGGHNGQTLFEVMGGHNGDRLDNIMEVKEITVSDNPLAALAMDFDISDSVDLLGKVASDLQENMAVDSKGRVTGTSKYVTGYTGWSGKKSEQKGNFVAFHISVGELVIGTNVTVKVNGTTMDPDGLHVMRFSEDPSKTKAYVVASADGHKDVEMMFDFSHVTRLSS